MIIGAISTLVSFGAVAVENSNDEPSEAALELIVRMKLIFWISVIVTLSTLVLSIKG
jgi:hypothetical protein